MEIEGLDPSQQAEDVKRAIDLDGCRPAVRRGGGAQAETVLDRHAKTGQHGACEATEALPGWDATVAVVHVLGDLAIATLLPRRIRDITDVVVRTDKEDMVGVVEKALDRFDLFGRRLLIRAKGIEADHDDGVGAADQRVVEPLLGTLIADALDLYGLATGLGFGQFSKRREVRLLDVVEKARDALIYAGRIRKAFKFG
jgi:hypothetical protein